MNTMIYCGKLDVVQTYFMNYVMGSKSVLRGTLQMCNKLPGTDTADAECGAPVPGKCITEDV